jgi:opacity protein-like surface antigen
MNLAMKTNQHSILILYKITLMIVLLMLVHVKAEAQESEKNELSKFVLYTDAGVHLAGQASLNFEGRIDTGDNLTLYGRVGIGAAGIAFHEGGPGILTAVTMLTGKEKNHFEMNGGIFLALAGNFVFPLVDLGYRYQKPEGGFVFRAKAGVLGVGIGLGYAF